jgi:selenocysteine lyase/cysteine desulfurase
METMIDQVRDHTARLIGAQPAECTPMASCSDGVNAVAAAVGLVPGDNVVVTDVEYPSNLFPWLRYETLGVEIRRVTTNDGAFDASAVARLCDERTRIVAVSHVSYLTGFRCDLKAIATAAHAVGAILVVDATQSLGAVSVNVKDDDVDVLVASGLKWLLAPIGTGGMYIRGEIVGSMSPSAVSWMSMRDYRDKGPELPELAPDARRFMTSGNIPLSLYAGFVAATAELLELGLTNVERRVLDLSGRLIAGLHDLGFKVHTPPEAERRAGIVTVAVATPDAALRHLRDQRIHAVSRHGGIRFSPHHFVSDEEISRVVEAMHACR